MNRFVFALSAIISLAGVARAQNELQATLKDTDIAPHWIYDDLPKAKEQAKATGKPLLVVIRCVPCPPGKTLDRALCQPDAAMKALQDNFVCVRVIQTNGLDLRTFQYDYDNSWAAMFLNADGTIYGRFGTRKTNGPASEEFYTIPAFVKSMERALEMHKAFPANKAALAGNLGKEPEFLTPEKIPSLAELGSKATDRRKCIHCHMVREHAVRAKWLDNKLTLEDLWIYPMPDNIGLKLDRNDGLRVEKVLADSPAAKAGLQEGDVLQSLDGRPLLSMADVQWTLHNLPAQATLKVAAARGGSTVEKNIALSGNWKESDIAWRASSWYGLRYGLRTEQLPAAERAKRKLADDKLALLVRGLFGRGAPPLQKAGLKVGDVIIAVDGKTDHMTESQFLIDLRLKHGPKDSVKFTVRREGRDIELTVPMW